MKYAENGIPRRARLDLFTPAERAIYDAVGEVEKVGAHVLLTDAVILLQQARDKVADYIDGEFMKNEKQTTNEEIETAKTSAEDAWKDADDAIDAADKLGEKETEKKDDEK